MPLLPLIISPHWRNGAWGSCSDQKCAVQWPLPVCMHVQWSDVFSVVLGFFFFLLLIPSFSYHCCTELHNMWLCLAKLNFLALIYHNLAPPGTSGWSLHHTNTCCYTKTERWKWENIIFPAGSWGFLHYLRVFNPLNPFNPMVKGMQLMG